LPESSSSVQTRTLPSAQRRFSARKSGFAGSRRSATRLSVPASALSSRVRAWLLRRSVSSSGGSRNQNLWGQPAEAMGPNHICYSKITLDLSKHVGPGGPTGSTYIRHWSCPSKAAAVDGAARTSRRKARTVSNRRSARAWREHRGPCGLRAEPGQAVRTNAPRPAKARGPTVGTGRSAPFRVRCGSSHLICT
jgi:hypothetical protein